MNFLYKFKTIGMIDENCLQIRLQLVKGLRVYSMVSLNGVLNGAESLHTNIGGSIGL